NLYFDEKQAGKILNYVENGNTVFMSARSVGYNLLDSLKVDFSANYNILEKEIYPKLFSPTLQLDSLPSFKKGVFKATFTKIDTLKTTALGYYSSENPKWEEINYIKVNYGKGTFLLHNLPEAFSN